MTRGQEKVRKRKSDPQLASTAHTDKSFNFCFFFPLSGLRLPLFCGHGWPEYDAKEATPGCHHQPNSPSQSRALGGCHLPANHGQGAMGVKTCEMLSTTLLSAQCRDRRCWANHVLGY